MPENKRIANTGLRAGDEFMLEGILSYAQTKRPRKMPHNATQYEFPITLAFDAAHPIKYMSIVRYHKPNKIVFVQQQINIYLERS